MVNLSVDSPSVDPPEALITEIHGRAATLAPHSIASVYDSSSTRTLEGRVVQWEFIRPHPFITLSVEAPTGSQEWRLEMDYRWEREDRGFRVDTLKPGDRIVVTGSPSRAHEQRLYVRQLERPPADGFKYRHHD